MGTYRRLGLIVFLLLCAITGYSQNQRMASLFISNGMTNNGITRLVGGVTTTAGITNSGAPFTNSTISYFGGYAVSYSVFTNLGGIYSLGPFNSIGTASFSDSVIFNGGATAEFDDVATFDGGALFNSYLQLPNGAAPTTDATGEFALDTTITDHKSLLQYDGGADEMLVIAIPRAQLTATDGHVIKYNATDDRFEMGAVAGSGDITGGNANQFSEDSGVLTVKNWAQITNANFLGITEGGPLIRPPAKVLSTVTIDVTTTNFWTLSCATNFTLTLSGTPTNGALISLMVSNFAPTTDIIMTNAAGLFDFTVASNRTQITIASNSIALFGLRYTTNIGTGAGVWYLEQNEGVEYALEAGSNITLSTNGATRTVAIAANSAAGDSLKVNDTAVSDSASLTNTAASATVAATTFAVSAGTDPDPDKVTVTVGAASSTVAGIITAQDQTLAGIKYTSSGLSNTWYRGSGVITNASDAYVQTVNSTALLVTNNISYLSSNLTPSGNATNFAGDYTFAWRTYLMTNAFRLTGMVNVASADVGKAYMVKLRNYSGGALRVSVDAGFRRSGTNDVSVGNNQNADVLVTPDGTGGSNPTNHTVQIILYDSP